MSLPPEVPQPVNRPNAEAEPVNQLQKIEREMTGFERATLRWAKVAVIMSALAALFVCLQWWEMHQGGAYTHTLAQAADTQAKKMTDMSTAADKIRQAAEDMVTQDRRIADNAQKALDASSKQSKASLDASIVSSRLEQRAWVGVTDLHLVGTIEAGKPISAVAVLNNTGRTIARDVRSVLVVHTSLGPIDIEEYSKHPDEPMGEPFGLKQGVFNLFPNQIMNLPAQSGVPDAEAVEAIRTRIRILYAFGQVSYMDVFSRHHITNFCGVYTPPTYLAATATAVPSDARLGTCSTHNYAD